MATRKFVWTRDVENMTSTVKESGENGKALHTFRIGDIPEQVRNFLVIYGHDKLVDDRTSSEKDSAKKLTAMKTVHEMLVNGDLKKAREAAGERVSVKSVVDKIMEITDAKKRKAAIEMARSLGINLPEDLK